MRARVERVDHELHVLAACGGAVDEALLARGRAAQREGATVRLVSCAAERERVTDASLASATSAAKRAVSATEKPRSSPSFAQPAPKRATMKATRWRAPGSVQRGITRTLSDLARPDLPSFGIQMAVANLADGDVLLLENVRFHPEEDKNDPAFAAVQVVHADVQVVKDLAIGEALVRQGDGQDLTDLVLLLFLCLFVLCQSIFF